MSTSQASIESAAGRSVLVRNALDTARQAHSGQIRNASRGLPYIHHPIAVAEVLFELGCSDVVLAAALLHDVVEDSELEVEDVRRLSGDRVAKLVETLTDNPKIEPYEARKREHRNRVEVAGEEAMLIYAADKLVNVTMLRSAYELEGEEVDEELKVSLDQKIYIWELDLEMLFTNAPSYPVVSELADRLADQLAGLWGDRAAEARASSG
jgi:GTP diphosphokinase / guanosine-3',5'-bis(diphosphate) 3'-diphosphatase